MSKCGKATILSGGILFPIHISGGKEKKMVFTQRTSSITAGKAEASLSL